MYLLLFSLCVLSSIMRKKVSAYAYYHITLPSSQKRYELLSTSC
jgi:hypothetical protein